MTVATASTETRYLLAGTLLGPFATVWPYEAPGDVRAFLALPGAAVKELVQGGDFSIVGLTPLLNGGAALLAADVRPAGPAWPDGTVLILTRRTAAAQTADLSAALVLNPQAIEDALDHLMRLIQELRTASSAPPAAVAPSPALLLFPQQSDPPDPNVQRTWWDTALGCPRIYGSDGLWHALLLS